jgi:LPS sulfotransferase NodH
MRRRDCEAQAASFARAIQTGHWHHWDPPPRGEPAQRPDMVAALCDEIERLERGWERWFDEYGVNPLEVVYEELADDPVGNTMRVLSFLGLSTDVEPRPLTVKMDREQCCPG